MELNKTENTFVLGIFLAFTGLIAALLLAYFANITAEPIALAAEESANQSLDAVLPDFDEKAVTKFKDIVFTGVFADGKFVGAAGEISVKGYGGDIRTLVGINPDGSVRSVIVLEHNETPGLGSNICVRKKQKTLSNIFEEEEDENSLPPNKILDYYSGKAVTEDGDPWKVEKDGGSCPFITGATVSSRALCKAVYQIVSVYTNNREDICSELEKALSEEK